MMMMMKQRFSLAPQWGHGRVWSMGCKECLWLFLNVSCRDREKAGMEGRETMATKILQHERARLLSSWLVSAASARRGVKGERNNIRNDSRHWHTSDPWIVTEEWNKENVQPRTQDWISSSVSARPCEIRGMIDWQEEKTGDTAWSAGQNEEMSAGWKLWYKQAIRKQRARQTEHRRVRTCVCVCLTDDTQTGGKLTCEQGLGGGFGQIQGGLAVGVADVGVSSMLQ